MTPEYLATARLLVEVAPVVFEGESFALKGGAAINFFLRDLPRLSVDLDLVFTDYRLSREQALETIRLRLVEAKARLDKERGLIVQLVTTKERTRIPQNLYARGANLVSSRCSPLRAAARRSLEASSSSTAGSDQPAEVPKARSGFDERS